MKKELLKNLVKLVLSFLWAYGIYKLFSGKDFVWTWIAVGMPFGFSKMRTVVLPTVHAEASFGIAVLLLNFVISGLIGGFVLAFRMLVYIKNIITAIIFWNVPVVEESQVQVTASTFDQNGQKS